MSESSITSTAHPTSNAVQVKRGEVQLRGLWLRVIQGIWLVLVLIDLATLLVSLPAYYHTLFTLCPGPVTRCPDTGQLSAQTLPTLQHAGFSLTTYAFYVMFLDLLTTLPFLLIGTLIIWRRVHTWMGLFVSFLLITMGALGLSFAHLGGLPTNSSDPLLNLLSSASIIPMILYYPCLSFFFSTFPDGRFVPCWSWALIGLWAVNFFFWTAPLHHLSISPTGLHCLKRAGFLRSLEDRPACNSTASCVWPPRSSASRSSGCSTASCP